MLDLLLRGRRVVFDSPLGMHELTSRLAREVAAPAWPRQTGGPARFEGTFGDGRFRMMRRVNGRNSFRPVMAGQLSPAASGVRIAVELRVHPLVLGMVIVLAAVAGPLAALAVGQSGAPGYVSAAAPIAVFAVVLVVVDAAVHAEARTATRLLAELFETEPVLT